MNQNNIEQNIYPADETALLLIDTLNEFLSEDGKLWERGKEVIEGVNLLDNLERLLAGVRSSDRVKIVFAPHRLDEHSFQGWQFMTEGQKLGLDFQVFWAGSKGADFHPLTKPTKKDLVASPHRGANSFINSDLDAILRQNGIRRLVLAGMTANTCVESTGRYALELGYHVTFLKDAVAAFGWDGQRAATEVNYPVVAHAVLSVNEFLDEISKESKGV